MASMTERQSELLRGMVDSGHGAEEISTALGLTLHQVGCAVGRYRQLRRADSQLLIFREAGLTAAEIAALPDLKTTEAAVTARLALIDRRAHVSGADTHIETRAVADAGGAAAPVAVSSPVNKPLRLLVPPLRSVPAGPAPRGCQFIEGNDFVSIIRRGESPFCGASVVGGSPYCREHRLRCYTREVA